MDSVLGKITFKVISDQNQNHLSKIDLKSSSKSLTCEVISNQNHLFGVKIKITLKKQLLLGYLFGITIIVHRTT